MQSRTALLLVAFCLASPRHSPGQTVTYVAQERRVDALLYDEYVPRDDTQETVIVQEHATAEAPDFAPFDATGTARSPEPRYSVGVSQISQHSRLGPDGVFTAGQWHGHTGTIDGYYQFETVTAATFDVAGGTLPYLLDYRIDFPAPLPGTLRTTLSLRRLGDEGSVVFDITPNYTQQTWGAAAVGTRAGELSPGRYEFRFSDWVNNDYGLINGYDVQLQLSTVPEPSTAAAWLACAAAPLLRRWPVAG